MEAAPDFVPKDYAELYEVYFDFMQAILVQRGVKPKHSADVAMTILTRLIERDIIAMYQAGPRKGGGVTHTGKEDPGRPTKFRTFLVAFLNAYVMHWREKLARIDRCEPVFSKFQDENGAPASFLDEASTTTVEGLLFDRARMTVVLLRSRLAAVEDRLAWEGPSMAEILALIEVQGKVSVGSLAIHFGVPRVLMEERVSFIQRAAAQVREELQAA